MHIEKQLNNEPFCTVTRCKKQNKKQNFIRKTQKGNTFTQNPDVKVSYGCIYIPK